jgi:hypothetical protein
LPSQIGYHEISDLAEAMKRQRIRADWTARSHAVHTKAVSPQGAFTLAKAKSDAAICKAIDHLRR